MRPIRNWATTFHFTAEQQAEVNDLANRTGVTIAAGKSRRMLERTSASWLRSNDQATALRFAVIWPGWNTIVVPSLVTQNVVVVGERATLERAS